MNKIEYDHHIANSSTVLFDQTFGFLDRLEMQLYCFLHIPKHFDPDDTDYNTQG